MASTYLASISFVLFGNDSNFAPDCFLMSLDLDLHIVFSNLLDPISSILSSVCTNESDIGVFQHNTTGKLFRLEDCPNGTSNIC